MIITLYGPDAYRRHQKFKEIVRQYTEKHSHFTKERFDLAETGALQFLKEFIQTRSLFNDVKLGIIYNADELSDADEKEFRELLKNAINDTEPVLLMMGDKKPTAAFNFLLKKPVLAQEFKGLSGDAHHSFIQQEAKKRGVSLDKESIALLASVYRTDTWGLITEIEKLALLDTKTITQKIVEAHITNASALNLFGLLDSVRAGQTIGTRLSGLEELLRGNDYPGMLFNILAASPYGDHADRVMMADYDIAIKSGKIEYEEALLGVALGV
ncbi:MAG: hypothetical protein Q8R26_03750 [bacterium]|nr:hypothetical protein [bacterium]